jgi:hypothetical protein
MKFSIKVKLPGEDIQYSYNEKVPLQEVDQKLADDLKNGVLKIHVPDSHNFHLVPVFNNVRDVYVEVIDLSEQVPDDFKELLKSDTVVSE